MSAPASNLIPSVRPLWPQPIPVIVLSGEKWSGKTIFSLSIAGPDTIIYDTETSSLSYIDDVGATRIDVMEEMHKLYPKGHKAIDRYLWWIGHVRSLPTGKFKVVVCDTVNEIESGLADWVKNNPGHFGHSAAQYIKMSGIMWGDVKDHWLSIISSELKGRCETVVLITHMGNVWGADNKPTGKRKPKGKDTLLQVSSLFLEMERKKDAQGNLPKFPSAIVVKDRIARMRFDATNGEMAVNPLLPPRVPKATPAEIRRIMLQGGIDFANLAPDQMAPEEAVTEDERAAVRLATAEAERDTEQARLARADREQAASHRATTAPAPAPQARTPDPASVAPAATAVSPPTNGTAGPRRDAPSAAQLAKISGLRARLWEAAGDVTDEAKKTRWNGVLERRKVKSALDLTAAQADELIGSLAERLNVDNPLDKFFRGEKPPAECAAVPAGSATEPVDPHKPPF